MLIEIEDVSYTYLAGSEAANSAVSNASLTIDRGEFIALIGPTGSGKSTLAQVLAGLLKPSFGKVIYEGSDIWEEPKLLAKRRSLTGLVFQEPEKQLFEMTVEEDIAFWPKNLGLGPKEITTRAMSALSAVGLDYEQYKDRSPFTLSGGEMRRVAIAGILVMNPKVLIVDEPTVGLDHRGRTGLMDKIQKLNQGGTAIVFVSHDMDTVAEYAQRVVLINEGSIIQDSSPREVFRNKEMLNKVGLDVPVATEIGARLREVGYHIAPGPISVSELETGILATRGEIKR